MYKCILLSKMKRPIVKVQLSCHDIWLPVMFYVSLRHTADLIWVTKLSPYTAKNYLVILLYTFTANSNHTPSQQFV